MSATPDPKPGDPGSLPYIEATLVRLQDMAANDERPFLAYLINIAHLEASRELEGKRVTPSGSE